MLLHHKILSLWTLCLLTQHGHPAIPEAVARPGQWDAGDEFFRTAELSCALFQTEACRDTSFSVGPTWPCSAAIYASATISWSHELRVSASKFSLITPALCCLLSPATVMRRCALRKLQYWTFVRLSTTCEQLFRIVTSWN